MKVATKPWWASKTIWGVIITTLAGVYYLLTGDVAGGSALIGVGLGLLGLRTADKPLR